MAKDDPRYGEIPLVIATNGHVLSHVKDCPEYLKELAKLEAKREGKGKKKRGVDEETSAREVRPLPSRVMPSVAASPNQRPVKRSREQSWQEGIEVGAELMDFGVHDMAPEPFVPLQGLWTLDPSGEEMDSYDEPKGQPGHYVSHNMEYPDIRPSGEHVRYGPPTDKVAWFEPPSIQTPSRDNGSIQHLRAPPLSLRMLAHQQQPPPSARVQRMTASHLHPHVSSQAHLSARIAPHVSEAPPSSQPRAGESLQALHAMSSSGQSQSRHQAFYREKVPPIVRDIGVPGPSRFSGALDAVGSQHAGVDWHKVSKHR